MNDDFLAHVPENMQHPPKLDYTYPNNIKVKPPTPDSVWVFAWVVSFFLGCAHDETTAYSFFCCGIWATLIFFTRKRRWMWIALQGFLWFIALDFICALDKSHHN